MMYVTLIGSGNVAAHLAKALGHSNAVRVVQLYARSGSVDFELPVGCELVSELSQLKAADLYLLAVSDDAIDDLTAALPFRDRLVAHTSGSQPLQAIADGNRKAVLYPLQTFSKQKAVDFAQIPVALEAGNPHDYAIIETVARSISQQVFSADSQQRKALHVAAVFANNFTNHLYKLAADICTEHQLSFDILKPLIAETAQKVMTLSPAQAQTGPAKRHDEKTLAAHRALLSGHQKDIYELLTQSIQDHGQEL